MNANRLVRLLLRLGLVVVAAAALGLGTADRALAVDAAYQNDMRNARLLMARGQPDRAVTLYERVLKKHPRDLPAIVGFTEAQIALGQLDEADVFLEQMLEQVEVKTEIYRVRVKLRRAQDLPEPAFDDVLLAVASQEERVSWALPETRDLLAHGGLDPAVARSRSLAAREEHPQSVAFTLLAGTIASLAGEPAEGLRLVSESDDANGLEGMALFRYAEEMEALKRPGEALAAYEASVARTTRLSRRTAVLFRMAELQEKEQRYEEAIASYHLITEERAGTGASGKALLASADIYQKHLDDPRGALEVYLQVQDDPILGHRRPDMLLQMADCYVRLDRLEEARATYGRVLPEAIDPEQAEQATFALAEMEFFLGRADTAMTLYQDMAEEYPRSLLADDAAQRYITLNKYQALSGGLAVQTLGRLEWGRQVADSAAVDSTANVLIANYEGGELAAEGLLALADLAEGAGRYEDALAYLAQISSGYAGDRRAPESLMRAGRILREELDRPQEAMLRYETVLTDYPNSLQVGEARRLVENLRRDLKL